MKSISVIIPIYNTEDYLRDCLKSIRRLSELEDIEVIMIDDGSTDRSGEIARAFASKHEEFSYYRTENGGQGQARNIGIERAAGKYILFCDSDDIIVADVYSEMLRIAEYNQADMTICAFTSLRDGRIRPTNLSARIFCNNTDAFPTSIVDSPMFVFDKISCNKLIRREFFEETGIRYPVGVLYEDIITMMQLHVHAKRCAVCWKTGYLWRSRNGENRSSSQKLDEFQSFDDKLTMVGRSMEYYREHYDRDEAYQLLLWKSAADDLKSCLKVLQKLPTEEGLRYINRMERFIEQYALTETLNKLPAIFHQIFIDIREKNLSHLIKVTNYWFSNYKTVPYIYKSADDIHLRLSDNLFRETDYDARNELTGTSPKCAVLKCYGNAGELHIRGYLYQKRVQTSDRYPQYVEACIADCMTGEKRSLPTKIVATGELTREKGPMICNDDYLVYEYQYDRNGFDISIDLEQMEKDRGLLGDNAVLIYHKNVLSEGTQIITGLPTKLKDKMRNWTYVGENARLSWHIDKSGALFLRKERIEDKSSEGQRVDTPVETGRSDDKRRFRFPFGFRSGR